MLRSDRLNNSLMRLAVLGSIAAALAGCDDTRSAAGGARAYRSIPAGTLALMEEKGTDKRQPVLIRTYKKEAEFEVWKMNKEGHYTLLKTFPMCRWSGQLGPKTREGDRQVPEGFYSITPAQMNPNSNYYLSFNVGYPNAYDRAYDRSGGAIMVHGACSSAGCFSMTDDQIAEIYAITREAFGGGQKAFQMQSLPFRMTAENLAKYRLDPNIHFWKELKVGVDNFDLTKQEPQVAVCNRHYQFNASPVDPKQKLDAVSACPPLHIDASVASALTAKQRADDAQVAELVAKGVKPIRTEYADGGQHPDFASLSGNVSRPDALAQGATDIELTESGKPLVRPAVVQVAALKADSVRPATTAGATTIARTPATAAPASTEVAAAVPAAPAPAVLALAATPEPVQQPFYKRFLPFGSEEKPAPPPSIEIAEPAEPVAADVPLPPRRSALKPVASRALPPSKPQASLLGGAQASLPAGFSPYVLR